MAKETELREELAKLAHEQWSGWMDYLFSKCINYKAGTIQAEAGAVIIPKWAVDRWRGQSKTIYSDLTPAEMDSDRTEADKFLAVFNTRHADKSLVGLIENLRSQIDKLTIDCINLRELKMWREGRAIKTLPDSNPYKDQPCKNCERHADKELVTQPYKPEDLETNRMYLVCDANDDYLVAFWVGDMWDSPERGFLKVGEVAFCVGPIKEKP